MRYSVHYDSKYDCVFARIEGEIEMKELDDFAKEVVKQTSEHDCRRLINDLRKAQVKLSTLELYELPHFIEGAGLDRLCKRAVVVSQDFDDYRFFENISRRRGHLVEIFADSDKFSIFRDMEKAKEWLGLDTINP